MPKIDFDKVFTKLVEKQVPVNNDGEPVSLSSLGFVDKIGQCEPNILYILWNMKNIVHKNITKEVKHNIVELYNLLV